MLAIEISEPDYKNYLAKFKKTRTSLASVCGLQKVNKTERSLVIFVDPRKVHLRKFKKLNEKQVSRFSDKIRGETTVRLSSTRPKSINKEQGTTLKNSKNRPSTPRKVKSIKVTIPKYPDRQYAYGMRRRLSFHARRLIARARHRRRLSFRGRRPIERERRLRRLRRSS